MCIKSFQHFSSLEKHLDCDKNKYALEKEKLYDQEMTQHNWSMAVVPFLKLWMKVCIYIYIHTYIVRGWRSSATDGMGSEVRDSNKKEPYHAQKNYLTEVFQEVERTGKMADPSFISKAMRRAKLNDGSSISENDDFLTPISR